MVDQEGSKKINFKVKVYILDNSGTWDDCGQGQVSIVRKLFSEKEVNCVQVMSEQEVKLDNSEITPIARLQSLRGESTDMKCIMELPIVKDKNFERQGDTIISWFEAKIKEDVAISFQEQEATEAIWNKICEVLGDE